ncbi:K06223 DNA adenine methylase [Streptococcus dysgalactiae subsp. equisimilis AC-2713]|uniref:site-specific DNA-methyltransferase (adenine-specific) n=1 Tax=Streptococcus dysgalactiae subsp. equisimilis AC-2713 TaxID=759913 RepID=A0AB33R7T5_STREQ|nr:DNA adenine methylase [Streptococcus dysgalactiae]CCI63037.1 K06223 DNA adenine methylase [Streptococcus dysgalactiae subsp. equisimilis AC-2713]
MRYLGNKTKLLPFIEHVLDKYQIEGNTFADLFSGTGAVGDFFKGRFQILSNDFLYYSYVLNRAKLMNTTVPKFEKFKIKYKVNVYEWLNEQKFSPNEYYFIYNNYSPVGERMFFSKENAIQIDGIRIKIEELLLDGIVNDEEYYFLLASLLESVTRFSNTSGTFEAFFKFWDSRSQNKFMLSPLELVESDISVNKIFSEDTNELVRKISGDIAYIDPPYTVTQYVSAYHMLETIAKYDFPKIKGVGGKRDRGNKNSLYARKTTAKIQFEDLFRQIQFRHVLISYSNQGIVPLEELVDLAKKFAVNNEVFVETQEYQEYQNHRSSNKGNGKKLKEVIIYFQKDLSVNKSPLNYSGSKDRLLPAIVRELPKHVCGFVDMMGGAFNVGANIVTTDFVRYNELNPYVYGLVRWLLETDKNLTINKIKEIITSYGLEKADRNSYQLLREKYNLNQTSEKLFVLHMYSFQNMIRFNSSSHFNTPVGVAGFSNDMIDRIQKFNPKTRNFFLSNDDYKTIDFEKFPKDTVFYFDPPYFITSASYNDGRRGFNGWSSEQEAELLDYLTRLDSKGYKFILSNVIYHKDKTNHLLEKWIEEHNFNVINAGVTGWRYAKNEVLIKNY